MTSLGSNKYVLPFLTSLSLLSTKSCAARSAISKFAGSIEVREIWRSPARNVLSYQTTATLRSVAPWAPIAIRSLKQVIAVGAFLELVKIYAASKPVVSVAALVIWI